MIISLRQKGKTGEIGGKYQENNGAPNVKNPLAAIWINDKEDGETMQSTAVAVRSENN